MAKTIMVAYYAEYWAYITQLQTFIYTKLPTSRKKWRILWSYLVTVESGSESEISESETVAMAPDSCVLYCTNLSIIDTR